MAPPRLLALATLAAAAAAEEWEYYCLHGASALAALDRTTPFHALPSPGRPQPPAQPGDRTAPPAHGGEQAFVEVAERMRGLTGTCYFMRAGYWTYEVCPGKRIRQYHSENALSGAAKVRIEHSLGVYDSGGDEYIESKGVFSQRFKDGTDGRATKVQFVCGAASGAGGQTLEDGLISVTEPAEKKYLIAFRTNAMCNRARSASGRDTVTNLAPTPEVHPPSDSKEAPAAGGVTSGSKVASTDGAGGTGSVQVMELELGPLGLLEKIYRRCFTLTSGYWTYEVCPGRSARQFRLEGKITTTEMQLGSYDETKDRLSLGTPPGTAAGLAGHIFYTQSFTNGAGGRTAELRARCNPKNEHALVAVVEPTTHHYILDFVTPFACEIGCVRARLRPDPDAR
mmetsp:Transcript_23876/g.73077  ORF Transcript_23876/g.73077 Transcript_23876/m.73077 type:complete len:397 (-) Transcript_23876:234-1424(-)